MMGRRDRDQASLFYDFNLDDVIPENHLLRRLDVFVTAVLPDLHEQLQPFYSDIGRPSVDPELMMRMLIVGYCYGSLDQLPARCAVCGSGRLQRSGRAWWRTLSGAAASCSSAATHTDADHRVAEAGRGGGMATGRAWRADLFRETGAA